MRRLDQMPNLRVDLRGDLFGIVALVAHVAPEEHLVALAAELQRPQLVAHAELGDHSAGDLRCLLDVVAGARGRLVEDKLLGGPSAQEHRELVQHLRSGAQVTVLERQLHGVTERPAAGQNRNLVDGIAVRQGMPDKGVSALVVGDPLLLLVAHDPVLAFRPGHHPVDRLLQQGGGDELLIGPRCEQRGLVEHVREVRASEPRGAARDDEHVDIGFHRLALGVHLQDRLAAEEVGAVDNDLPVEPSRP